MDFSAEEPDAPSAPDPFSGGPSPFGPPGQPPPAPDPFGAAPDPFGAAPDPFGGGAPDPFGGGAPDPFGGAAADPFQGAVADDGGFGPSPASALFPAGDDEPPPPPPPSPGDDPFSGLDAEPPADPYAPDDVAPSPHSETRIHSVPDEIRQMARGEEAPPPKPQPREDETPSTAQRPARRSAGLPPFVLTAASAALQAVVLVAFLAVAVVVARGGTPADLVDGRGVDVILGRSRTPAAEHTGPLVAEDVVVVRRPVAADPELVVVTGVVTNRGEQPVPAARVEVQFSTGEGAFAGWAKRRIDGLDLEGAADRGALEALTRAPPDDAQLAPGTKVPFTVLASGVPVGARASLRVVEAGAPTAPADPEARADDKPRPPAPGKSAKKTKPRTKPKPKAKPSPGGDAPGEP